MFVQKGGQALEVGEAFAMSTLMRFFPVFVSGQVEPVSSRSCSRVV